MSQDLHDSSRGRCFPQPIDEAMPELMWADDGDLPRQGFELGHAL
jgi:hypothetical protein